MTTKVAQEMLNVTPDVGQLLGRMRQIAAAMRWTEDTSPALAFVEAAQDSRPVDESMRAAALADLENYTDAAARRGLDESTMDALRELIHDYMPSKLSHVNQVLKIAAKFEKLAK
jgi:hypothetical protein